MAEYRITFDCELQEDMHSGTGQGWLGLIDDRQARDVQGRPVVWNTTLAGLVRDAADELMALGHDLARLERIRRVCGSEGSEARGNLVCGSLHFSRLRKPSEQDLPPFAVVVSTTREVHSRRPLDGTLRSVEVAAAGLTAQGEMRLFGDSPDRDFLLLCLRRITSLGGGKTRGLGQIRLANLKADEIKRPTAPAIAPHSAGRLRLLLENVEPVCLPTTGHPGNIIDSETHLPGQALRGAWLRALTDQGAAVEHVDELAQPAAVRFSNGYLVRGELLQRAIEDPRLLEKVESLPLPLSAQEAKPTEKMVSGHSGIPWWSLELRQDRWLAEPAIERDSLLGSQNNAAPKGARFKRIKTADYLVDDGSGAARRLRPEVITLQRNRTPVNRVQRQQDSRRAGADEKELLADQGQLFSQVALAENQHFLTEIRLETLAAAQQFVALAGGFLHGELPERAWLRVGRGGRPVRVVAWHWMPDVAAAPPPSRGTVEGGFTLTLTSDLIARADDLGFVSDLDAATLARLSGAPLDPSLSAQIHVKNKSVEARVMHGFNTAAGTRRHPALALLRGSAFLFQGPENAVLPLYAELVRRADCGRGLGERQEEGFGRFVINHPAHQAPPDATQPNATAGKPALRPRPAREDERIRQRRAREDAIAAALKAVEELQLSKLCRQKDFPSRGQWQQLRHRVERKERAEVQAPEQVLAQLLEHAKDRSGKMWACGKGKGLIHALDEHRKQLADEAAQRTFLIHVARWVVVELDRCRQEPKE